MENQHQANIDAMETLYNCSEKEEDMNLLYAEAVSFEARCYKERDKLEGAAKTALFGTSGTYFENTMQLKDHNYCESIESSYQDKFVRSIDDKFDCYHGQEVWKETPQPWDKHYPT